MKRPPETVAFLFGVKGAEQRLPLLADRARSECVRSMRAIGSPYTHSARLFTKIARSPPVSQQSMGPLQICQLWHIMIIV